jgi:hypothetical protein
MGREMRLASPAKHGKVESRMPGNWHVRFGEGQSEKDDAEISSERGSLLR